jgi:predicted HAD superfamily Cof-like phosphohydrolase
MADIDNVKIANDLNKLLVDRRAILQAQTREMQSQLQLALQFKAVFDGMKADELVDRLNEAKKAFDEIAENAKNSGNIAEQAMQSMSSKTNSVTQGTSKLNVQLKLLTAKYPSLKSVGAAALSGLLLF